MPDSDTGHNYRRARGEDAVYPSDADGRPIDGEDRYVLHFEKDQLPPVIAFRSVTMYDLQGYPVGNPISRFAIRDRDAQRQGADGSLDLDLDHESPGPGREANRLPFPVHGHARPDHAAVRVANGDPGRTVGSTAAPTGATEIVKDSAGMHGPAPG